MDWIGGLVPGLISAHGPFSVILGDTTMSIVPDSNEPNPQGDLTPPAEAPGPRPAPLLAQTTVTDIPRLQASLSAVGAALVAAFLAWGIGERTYDYYRPSASAQQNARDFTAMNREKRIADKRNTAIAFGTFGALLGLLSGAAGGALRRSIPGGSMAALAGLLVGGIAGARGELRARTDLRSILQ